MTYKAAREAILDAYTGMRGVTVKRTLKVPQVILPSRDVLYFRTQAVYLNAHSTWLDIRGMTPAAFIEEIRNRIIERSTNGCCPHCSVAHVGGCFT